MPLILRNTLLRLIWRVCVSIVPPKEPVVTWFQLLAKLGHDFTCYPFVGRLICLIWNLDGGSTFLYLFIDIAEKKIGGI